MDLFSLGVSMYITCDLGQGPYDGIAPAIDRQFPKISSYHTLPRGPGRPRHHARTRPHGIRSLAGDRGHRDDHYGLLPRSDHRILHTRISSRLVGTAAEAPELESRVQAA